MALYRGSGKETVGVTDSVPVSGYKFIHICRLLIHTCRHVICLPVLVITVMIMMERKDGKRQENMSMKGKRPSLLLLTPSFFSGYLSTNTCAVTGAPIRLSIISADK